MSLPTSILALLADAGKPGRVVGPVADLLCAAGWRVAKEQRRSNAEAAQWISRARQRIYREIWADAARYHGVEQSHLPGGFILIGPPEGRTLVMEQQVMLDYGVTLQLALDKAAVHSLLEAQGIPMARSTEFDAGNSAAGRDFLATARGPCVVKPRDSAGGEGVTCGVRTAEEFERSRLWARRHHSRLIIEEQASGDEYRFLFLDGDLLDVLLRRPPIVVGDGRSSVGQLIAEENRRRAVEEGAIGLSCIGIDLDCLLTLENAGMSLRSVPAAGETVKVKTSTNQASAEQVQTVRVEAIGAKLVRDARAAAVATGLRLAGVELITPSSLLSLKEAGGVVVEVNGTPGLHYHYLVSDKERCTKVARPLLAALLDSSRTRKFPPFDDHR